MSAQDDGGSASPPSGMSLRDWFAGQAGKEALELLMQHYGTDWMGSCLEDAIEKLAETKLKIADAMLEHRKPA